MWEIGVFNGVMAEILDEVGKIVGEIMENKGILWEMGRIKGNLEKLQGNGV